MTSKIILLTLIIMYQLLLSIYDYRSCMKLKVQDITEALRVKIYRLTVVDGVFPVLLIAIFSFFSDFTMKDIGLRGLSPIPIGWLPIVTYIIAGVAFLLFLYQTIMCIMSREYQIKAGEQLASSEQKGSHYDMVLNKIAMPRTKKEKFWYSLVSLTAGICEEIVGRGCILFLLQSIFPELGFLFAGIISCVLFALMHAYQGILGIIKTGIVGGFFVLLYYVTGSLIPGMILHFLLDFSSTFLLPTKTGTEIQSTDAK